MKPDGDEKKQEVQGQLVEERGLREERVEDWLDFLAQIFPATGRAYFERHLKRDPHADRDLIFVVYERTEAGGSGAVVSTIRVFVREVFIAGRLLSAGGIGEVSTRKEWRGQGLASTLLERCFEAMNQKEIKLSMLHAGKAAMPLYQRKGYEPYLRFQTAVRYPLERLAETASVPSSTELQGFKVVHADFENDAQVSRLRDLYREFNMELGFSGWFRRDSNDYWKLWVSSEHPINSKDFFVALDENGTISAFFSAKEYKRDADSQTILLNLTDFAIDLSLVSSDRITDTTSTGAAAPSQKTAREFLEVFAQHWIHNRYFSNAEERSLVEGQFKEFQLMVPTPVVKAFTSFGGSSGSASHIGQVQPEDIPLGNAMFLNVSKDPELDAFIHKGLDPLTHVFWGTDDF